MSVDDLNVTSVRVDRVMDLYRREILRVHREDTLVAVSREFERKRTAIAMVVDDDDRLLGIVSLGDIVHAIGEHGANALRPLCGTAGRYCQQPAKQEYHKHRKVAAVQSFHG